MPKTKKQRKIEERRLEVLRLKLRGLTNRVIAATVDPSVTERTVDNDLAYLRKAHGDVFRKRSSDEILAEMEVKLMEVETQAWDTFHAAPTGSGNRVRALTEVRTAVADRLNLLVKTGVISEQPKKVEMDVTHLHTLEGFEDTQIDAIEDNLLMARLSQSPGAVPAGLLVDAEFEEAEEGQEEGQEAAGAAQEPKEAVSVPPVPWTPKRREAVA